MDIAAFAQPIIDIVSNITDFVWSAARWVLTEATLLLSVLVVVAALRLVKQ